MANEPNKQKNRDRSKNATTTPAVTKPAKYTYLALITMALSTCVFLVVVTQLMSPPVEQASTQLSGRTMGTSFNVIFDPPNQFDLSSPQLMTKITDRLLQINAEMSTYEPGSTISKFNKSTKVDHAFEVSPDFAQLCQTAKSINVATDGQYDITVGPLVNLWGFGPKGSILRAPTDESIEQTLQSVGSDKIKIDATKNTISKVDASTQIDLSSIAKGYGVDEIANLLNDVGIENFLVEIGGEMIASGVKSNGAVWTAAIELPVTSNERIPAVKIELVDCALATSGNYRTFMEDVVTGIRYAHTIDPTTGRPRQSTVLSVSVVADRCALADARATALMASPADQIKQIAEREGWSMLAMVFDENAGESESKIKVVASSKFTADYSDVALELEKNLERLESLLPGSTPAE